MSKEYEGKDPIQIATEAERDLNSQAAQGGTQNTSRGVNSAKSDSAKESGVDDSVESKFPGAQVTYGSAASGAGGNRDMPEGGVNPSTGQNYKARDFEGAGGPEDKAAMLKETNPGSDEVRDNIRSGGYGDGQNRKG